MRFARIVSSRIGHPLLAVLLATAGILSTNPMAEAEPGTLAPGGLSLDAITIPELQERMQFGALTAVDLTQAYLDRIAEVNDEVRAVLSVNAHALDEAAHSDVIRAQQGQRSEMEGIPVLLKDNVDAEGMPTTAGSRALLHSEPDDATITRKLRDAGAIVIGKANLSEWANFRAKNSTSGWSGAGGQTANPYVLDRSACSSSSGSAAGVAASLAQVAVGTETSGSIVCPSGTTGVVGLKPTLGTVSREGIVPISAEQDTAGPIARHAVDAAILLSAIAGRDPADAATAERPADFDPNFAELDPHKLKGARIGVLTLTPDESQVVDDGTEAVFAMAVEELMAAGAKTVPVQLAHQEEIRAGETPALLAEFHRDIEDYLAATPGNHPADLAGLIAFDRQDPEELAYFGQELFEQAEASPVPADNPAVRAQRSTIRSLARGSIDDALARGPEPQNRLDAIVALTNTPGWVTKYFNRDGVADEFLYGSAGPAAVAGYPNVTVPAGFAGPQGALPIGISFIGARWHDADVLDLAYAFETATKARRTPGYLPTVGG
ncbi:amidase family protein [Mycobacterium sp. ITM-2016-00318]|uniref:amidase family protein n=1 Tax=Mycobacterium sp. ITM-2016-00318 TaxID=2099693 RepID=UPI0018EB0436|nr:amidase family protein [Mycobacterium sp. ITM-2016-00318]WNG94318.1 amidase family protein [Mycobacterium sp. ITM-2016-00318]